MPQLQLLPRPPATDGPTRGERRIRPLVSHLQVLRPPPAAFPTLRPPATPLLDEALARATAKEAPPLEHVWHTERLLNTDTMRKELRTWCLRCDARKVAGDAMDGTDQVAVAQGCHGELDARVTAPWAAGDNLKARPRIDSGAQ